MTKGQKIISSLLVVVATLLALNLVVMGSRTANAEATVAGEGDPYIVKLLYFNFSNYERVWSDGRVDAMSRVGESCEYLPGASFGPVDHPFPVVDAVLQHRTDGQGVMATYEDGRVDLIGWVPGEGRCTIAGIGTPSLCTADTDRDGDVDVTDLLTLLAQWGPCL